MPTTSDRWGRLALLALTSSGLPTLASGGRAALRGGPMRRRARSARQRRWPSVVSVLLSSPLGPVRVLRLQAAPEIRRWIRHGPCHAPTRSDSAQRRVSIRARGVCSHNAPHRSESETSTRPACSTEWWKLQRLGVLCFPDFNAAHCSQPLCVKSHTTARLFTMHAQTSPPTQPRFSRR